MSGLSVLAVVLGGTVGGCCCCCCAWIPHTFTPPQGCSQPIAGTRYPTSWRQWRGVLSFSLVRFTIRVETSEYLFFSAATQHLLQGALGVILWTQWLNRLIVYTTVSKSVDFNSSTSYTLRRVTSELVWCGVDKVLAAGLVINIKTIWAAFWWYKWIF